MNKICKNQPKLAKSYMVHFWITQHSIYPFSHEHHNEHLKRIYKTFLLT
jgi:hypothetical protein